MSRTCGVTTKDGTPCEREVAGRRKYCDKHPGGRSKYRADEGRTCAAMTQAGQPCSRRVTGRRTYCDRHPGGRTKQVSKARAQARVKPEQPPPWSPCAPRPSASKQRTRQERVGRRAVKAAPRLDDAWTDLVLDHAAQAMDEHALLLVTAADCATIARTVAPILHEGHKPRQRQVGWAALLQILDAPSAVEAVAASVSESLGLPSEEADIAAARALQSVGVAMCRRAGVPLTDCPCFALSAAWEVESVLFLFLRLAMGDWTSLVVPFDPLTSP